MTPAHPKPAADTSSPAWWLLLLLLLAAATPAEPDFFIDSDWLAEHLHDTGLIILETRLYPHRYTSVGHIPGARQVQRIKDLGNNRGDPLMRFPSREAFQRTLRRWGVNDDSTLVLYDDANTVLLARLYFLLELYGYDMRRVKVLAGGLEEWTAFEELSKETVAARPGHVRLKAADPSLFVEWETIYDDIVARRDPAIQLIDARTAAMYSGKQLANAVRGGHIPGAINIDSLEGVSAQRWKSDARLQALYAPANKNKTLYLYCNDGFRMSLAYMQLKHLGARDVRLYNGGWSHWGNHQALPVVSGEQPYSGAFDL